MRMSLPLIKKALFYTIDAHWSNRVNFFAGVFGMAINNAIFLIGMWGMLFAGKPQNSALIVYYVALNSVCMTSWGIMNFFLGGWKSLGEVISEGALEPMLATPRDPLFLAGISKSHLVALGDVLIGLLGFCFLFFKISFLIGLKCLFALVISCIGFGGIFILAGAISFFVGRGSEIGLLLIEMTLSLSCYPTGKMFTGDSRIILLLTPALVTAILPLEAVEYFQFKTVFLAIFAAFLFFFLSVVVFRLGLKRYQSVNIVGFRI